MADSFIVSDFSADDFDDVFGDKQQTAEKAKPVNGNDSQQEDAWSAPETISDDTSTDPWQAEPLNNNANEESELDWFADTDAQDNNSADSAQDAWGEDSFADIWSDIDTETPAPGSRPEFNENDSQQASGDGEDDWFTEPDSGQEPVTESEPTEPEPEPEPAIETLPAPQPLPEVSTTSDDEDDGWFDDPEPASQSADTADTGEGLDDPWASPAEWEETPSEQAEQASSVEEPPTEVIEPVTPVSEPQEADNADSEDGWFDDATEVGWATESEPQTKVIQPVESKHEPAFESEDDWFTEPSSETRVNAPQNDVDTDWDTWADEPTQTNTTPVEEDTAPHAGGFLQTDLTDDARQMENWLEPVTPENNEQPSQPAKKTKVRHLPQKRTIIIAGIVTIGIIALAGIGVGIKNVITKTQHDKQIQQAEASKRQADSEAKLSYANAKGKADKLIKSIQASPIADDEELKNGVTGLQDTLNAQHPHTRAEYQASAKTITTATSPLQKTYTDKMTAKANEVAQRLGDLIGRANGLSTAPDSDSKTHMQSLVKQWGGKKITVDNVSRAIAAADSLQSDVDSVQRSMDDANAQQAQPAPAPAPSAQAPAPAPAPKKQAPATPKKPAPAAPKQTTTPRNQAPAPARPAPAPAPNNGGSSGGNTGVNIG